MTEVPQFIYYTGSAAIFVGAISKTALVAYLKGRAKALPLPAESPEYMDNVRLLERSAYRGWRYLYAHSGWAVRAVLIVYIAADILMFTCLLAAFFV